MEEENKNLNGNTGENVEPTPEQTTVDTGVSEGATNEATAEPSVEAQAVDEDMSAVDFSTPVSDTNESKKKGTIIKVIIAVVVICIIAVAVRAFANPEKQVMKALTNTGEQFSKRISLENTDTLISKMQKGELNTAVNADVTLKSLPMQPELEGAGLSFTGDFDYDNKLANMEIGMMFKGIDMVLAEIFTDNDIMKIKAPICYDKAFVFNTKNIKQQIAEAPWNDSEDINVENDVNLNIFPIEGEDSVFNTIDATEAAEDLVSICTEAKDVATKNMSVVKNKGSVDVETKDGSVKAKSYTVTFNGEDSKSALTLLITNIRNSEPIKEYLLDTYTVTCAKNMQDDITPEDMLQEVYTSLDEMLTGIETVTFEDITINVSVYKNVIVDFAVNAGVDFEGDLLKIQLTGGLKDTVNPENALDFKLKLSDDIESVSVNFVYSDNYSKTDSDIVYNSNISLGEEGSSINMTIDHNFNVADKKTTGVVNFTDGSSEEIAVSWDGTYDVQEDSANIQIDSLEVKVNEVTMGIVSINYQIGLLTEAIEIPQGEAVEIFKIDEDTLNGILEEVQQGLYTSINGLAG